MDNRQFKDAVNLALDKRDKKNRSNYRAVVFSSTPQLALIRIGGSTKVQEANINDGLEVGAGDIVQINPNTANSRVRWVITDIIEKKNTSLTGADRDYTELFPPSNMRQVSTDYNKVVAAWDYPYGSDVTFEVQSNTSESESGTTDVLLTKGSYAIIDTSTVIYIRARSIAPDGQKSSWSDWLELTPNTEEISMNAEWEVTMTFDRILSANKQIVLDKIIIPSGVVLTIEGDALLKVV